MTRPRAADFRRTPLDLAADPLDVLRALRGRDHVVALFGAWSGGDAIITLDAIETAEDPGVLDHRPGRSGSLAGSWFGALRYDGTARLVRPAHVLVHRDDRWWLDSLGAPTLDVRALLDQPADQRAYVLGDFSMTPGPDGHRAGVARAIEHLAAGDIFQVNLCARLSAAFDGDPLDVFCAGLEHLRPAHAAWVAWPGEQVASFSPELFLRRHGTYVLTSPIKGTAALDSDPGELVASGKNRAENVMIVDLMRNDLGRLAVPGSVVVPALVRLERHAVWHLVSDVEAELPADLGDADLLAATFPPGSVTGAPKERAMQIIDDLEVADRHVYTGAIGHAGPGGLELNVAIRTFEFAPGRVWLGVGGGIVIDSDPDAEYRECLTKAAPLLAAIGGRLAVDAVDAPVPDSPAVTRVTGPRPDPQRGVFDTVLVRAGRPRGLAAHLARLQASVHELYGAGLPADLADRIRATATATSGDQRLRIDAVPGDSDLDVTITIAPLVPDAGPWTLAPRRIPGGWGRHKWIDRGALATADASEPLLVDADGSWLETARAALFLVLDDGLHTPAADDRLLPSTGRARVIDAARTLGIPVHERRITAADAARATEVFVVNALRGIVPVAAVTGLAAWPTGPTTRSLAATLATTVDAALDTDLDANHRTPASHLGIQRADAGAGTDAHVLFVDNHDSFVHNLVQYAAELGARTTVVRNDEPVPDLSGITHVVLSPGPGGTADAGICAEVVRRCGGNVPVLGVCLGHQVLGELLGGRVVRADSIGEAVVHGKPSLVHHAGAGVFAGLPTPVVGARYHSLVVTDLPAGVEVTARAGSGLVMGLRRGALEGVQIHPESILTQHGHAMLATFLRRTRLEPHV